MCVSVTLIYQANYDIDFKCDYDYLMSAGLSISFELFSLFGNLRLGDVPSINY